MSALCFSTGLRDLNGLRSPPWGITKHPSDFRLQEFTSPPDCKLQHLPETLPCLFSTTEPEKKRDRAPRERSSLKPVRVKVPQTPSTPNSPVARSWGSARSPAGFGVGAGAAENTHWAEPTLLSLFPSTLAGLASSTSCCSSVIGAAAAGHLQTSASLRPASGSSSRGWSPRGRRPSAPPRASPAPAAPRASRPGPGCPPPTWTRSSGRDWPERGGRAAREGRGGPRPRTAPFPTPGRRERKRKPVELVFLGEEANWPKEVKTFA